MSTAGAGERPISLAYHGLWSAVDWILPPRCGGCGKENERWCHDCVSQTRELAGPLCRFCGEPGHPNELCADCAAQPPAYAALRSFTEYKGPAREAVHALKYRKDVGLGEALARSMFSLLDRLDWPVDMVTPVPLGNARSRQRGYNQSTLLGLPLALYLGRQFVPECLVRKRETSSQVHLSAAERHQNVQDAFTADPALAAGKIVLVVDDVATTGATQNSCALALRTAGAKAVYGLTFARAVLNP